jgi:RecA-family ATPase
MERVVVVAGEGAGKSTLMRAVAVATAAGRHWLEPACRIPPQRTLMVDLENAPSMIRAKVGVMSAQLSRFGAEHEDRAWLWSRPGGINLRRAEDALLLQRVIGLVRPQLVCFGPVYKAYSDGGDRAEDSAREVIAVLDRLRERYRFALWVEHHAPLEQQGVRKLRPVGSGIWSRWPEFGVALRSAEPGDPRCTSLLFDRFRFDRDVREWPSHLHRGVRGWPWEGEWREGGMPAWLRLGTEFVEEKL